MKVISCAAGALLAALLLLPGCSSLNPFGGSKSAPGVAADGNGDAGGPPRPKRASEGAPLQRFDADGNEVVTRAELESTLTADFKKEDVNGNGSLDTDELRALNERLRKEANLSPVFDWNADGQLVYSEFATQWRTLFDRADRDGDAMVTASEMRGGRPREPRPLPQPEMSRVDPTR